MTAQPHKTPFDEGFKPSNLPLVDDATVIPPESEQALAVSPQPEPIYDVGRRGFVNPNILSNQFVVAQPGLAVCIDIAHIYNNADDKVNSRIVDVFIAVDLADGCVVAYHISPTITSSDVVAALTPYIVRTRLAYGKDRVLIIHADRGTQFTSAVYANLEITFPHVLLSTSNQATPSDNSPVERLNRTLFRNNRFFSEIGYPDYKHLNFPDVETATVAVKAVIESYNSSFKGERSLQMTPENAHWAFLWAAEAGLNTPTVELTWKSGVNDLDDREDLKMVQLYREMVRLKAENECFKGRKSLQEIRSHTETSLRITERQDQLDRDALVEIQRLDIQRMRESIDKLSDKMDLLNSKPTRKRKKPANPRPIRTAFTYESCLDFVLWGSDPTRTLVDTRNTLAIIICYGTGCRSGELRSFNYGNLRTLLTTQSVDITNFKGGGKQTKAISDVAAGYANRVLKALIDKLKLIGYKYSDSTPVFSAYNVKDEHPLSENHYNYTVNKTLAAFSVVYNSIHNTNYLFLSHSSRITFVTMLAASGVDALTIQKLTGHKDIRSIQSYDRYALLPEDRVDILNKAQADAKPLESESDIDDDLGLSSQDSIDVDQD